MAGVPSSMGVRIAWRTLWLLLSWLTLLVVILLSLLSKPPDIQMDFEHADKLKHCFAYFVLACAFLQFYRKQLYIVAALLVALGVLIEFFQGLGGVRVFDVLDMLANTTGVLLGMLLVMKTRLGRVLETLEKQGA